MLFRCLKLLLIQSLLHRCWAVLACKDEVCAAAVLFAWPAASASRPGQALQAPSADDTYLLQATRDNPARKSLKLADISTQPLANSVSPSLRFVITTVGTAFAASGHKISRTWGKDRKDLVYLVGKDAKVASQENILYVSNVSDVHYPPTEKNLRGLAEAYRRYPSDDWYLRCDDDSYVDVKGMTAFLQTFADKSPRYLGSYATGRAAEIGMLQIPAGMDGYAEGGFCEILSNSAMRALLPLLDSCIADASAMALEHRHSDVELGKCLFRAGVSLTKLPGSIFTRIGNGAKGTHPMAEPGLEALVGNKSSLLRAIVAHPLKDESHMSLVHEWHSKVAQKLAGVPIYWVGASSNQGRFYHMSANLAMLGAGNALVKHVEAVKSSEAFRVANFTPLETMLGIKATDSTVWSFDHGCMKTCQVKANANPASPGPVGGCVRDCQDKVLGCSLSHLKAIHQAYAENQPYALILEDDVDLAPATSWNTPLSDLVNKSSAVAWDVMQLIVHASPNDWLRLHSFWSKNLKPKMVHLGEFSPRSFHSTGAYLISRTGMERFVSAFPMHNGIIQVRQACVSGAMELSIVGLLNFAADDCLLSGDIFQEMQTSESQTNTSSALQKYIFTPPLLSDTDDIADAFVIHGASDFHEQSRRMWRDWFQETHNVF